MCSFEHNTYYMLLVTSLIVGFYVKYREAALLMTLAYLIIVDMHGVI